MTLEEKDLLKILGKHFGATLTSENVRIKTDPFEVEVLNVPLDETPEEEHHFEPPAPPPPRPRRTAPPAESEINPEVPDDLLDAGDHIPDDAPASDDPASKRVLGPNASSVPPPYNPEKEIV